MPDSAATQSGFQSQNYPMKLRMYQGGLTRYAFGGLNTTGGPIALADNDSSDLQNVDFNKFGSIVQRGGTQVLNPNSVLKAPCDGLYWYEYNSAGQYVREPINVCASGIYYMNELDGTWTNISPSGVTMAPQGNHADFDTLLSNVYITNGYNPPLVWTGTGLVTKMLPLQDNCYTFQVFGITVAPTVGSHYTNNGVNYTIIQTLLSVAGSIGGQLVVTGTGSPQVSGNLSYLSGVGDAVIQFDAWVINANIQTAKYVAQYNNYLLLANVQVDSVYYPTRIYWSNLEDGLSWSADNWIDVSKNDGQPITNISVLGASLVVYKLRSIYLMTFTGNSTEPFTVGRANPDVGCIAPFSVQECVNSHLFLGSDGIYCFDGINITKRSYEIDYTFINDINRTALPQAVSCMYKTKNRYLLALPSADSELNDTVIMYDYYVDLNLQATPFSIYKGWSPSAMTTFYSNGWDEKPYFSDYNGYTYETDIGMNDYPLNIKTPINSYYYTNWKSNDDLVHQKFSLSAYIYYAVNPGTLSFSYSYDFSPSDQYTQLIDTSGGGVTWGNFVWGQATWADTGGSLARVDINGRGRSVRFKFSNNNPDETFSVDGFAILQTGDTFE